MFQPNSRLLCNVISFGGETALINSFSYEPALSGERERQVQTMSAAYPNATVETVRMTYQEARDMLAKNGRDHWHRVAVQSEKSA